jgi:8-oxo-dGTP diphosphatase
MHLANYKNHHKILVAVDCIIFGFDGSHLKALLIRRGFQPEQGKWSLMGGFVGKNENADDTAVRVLYELTGISDIYMEQLYTFSDIDRDSAGRVISIAYFALINIADYSEQMQREHEAKWFSIRKLPPLIFDHKAMVLKAKESLRQKIGYQPIGFKLLPTRFTLTQLQNLYEAVFETSLDRRNFTKKIISLGILKKLNEKEKESSRKGAFYYVFDHKRARRLASP